MSKTGTRRPLRLLAVLLLVLALFTACTSSAQKAAQQLELGRKYLTEQNYTEAVAAFTEAIRLDPDSIEAYLGRAEVYVNLKQYEDAEADYAAVLEKTADRPYTQAEAYAGRAAVYEQTGDWAAAEADYSTALPLLDADKAKEEADADTLLALKKDLLKRHAAVCITLEWFDKASTDYDALEQLGEDVSAERAALEALLPAEEEPEEPEPEEPAQEQPAEEPAASSREEQPAASKTQQAAPAQPQSYTASRNDGWSDEEESHTETETVTVNYQVGSGTVKVIYQLTDQWQSTEEPGVQHTDAETHSYTYKLSQPLQALTRQGQWQAVLDVPAGTTVSCDVSVQASSDGQAVGDLRWSHTMWLVEASSVPKTNAELQALVKAAGGYATKDSFTVEAGRVYVPIRIDLGEGGAIFSYGGFIFRGV